MAENERDWAYFLKGFVIGGFAGALAGILFAPKSGKELRADIKEKGNEVLKDSQQIYEEATEKAKAIVDEAKRRAEELKKEADRRLSEARQKAKDMLARYEKQEGAGGPAKDVSGGGEV